MKFLYIFFLMAFLSCDSQSKNSLRTPVEFETVNHYPYNLTPEKFLVIDTQAKMDAVYSVIHRNTVGNRLAPIPSVNDGELYVVFKPTLKDTNDVEITGITTANDTLYVGLKESDNPQIKKASRMQPNILVKLQTKIPLKNIVTTYSN
ncbi:hypothetical protein [Kaistella palustris]|uniref:hypothetical protein n=1 Tax=Kaistella palustris TaxID=493376 RepID=UPI00041280C9|nr:hypothetical protein [Kaistella palustris]